MNLKKKRGYAKEEKRRIQEEKRNLLKRQLQHHQLLQLLPVLAIQVVKKLVLKIMIVLRVIFHGKEKETPTRASGLGVKV